MVLYPMELRINNQFYDLVEIEAKSIQEAIAKGIMEFRSRHKVEPYLNITEADINEDTIKIDNKASNLDFIWQNGKLNS